LYTKDEPLFGQQVGSRRLEVLADISRAIAEASLDLPRISETLSARITSWLGDACGVCLLSDDELWLKTASVDHRDADARDLLRQLASEPRPADEGPHAAVLRLGTPLFLPSAEPTEITASVTPSCRRYTTRYPVYSLLIVPISTDGEVIGTLSATRNQRDRPYTPSDQALLLELAERAGIAIATARRHQELLRERERLRAKSEELEAVMAAAPVAICVAHDPGGRQITGNPEAYRILNVPPGTNISPSARPPGEPGSYRVMQRGCEVAPEDLPMRRAVTTAQAVRDVEFDIVFEEGPATTMFGSAYPLFDEKGASRGSVGAFVDVTPMKNAIRVRDDFLSMASHELKTPLTSVELNITSLLRSVKTGRLARMTVAEIEQRLLSTWRDTKRLAALINDLLDVSRISAGRLTLEPTPFDLRELLMEIAGRFEEQTKATGCVLSVDVPEPVSVLWDRNRFDQILTNLVSNAVKYGRGRPVDVRAVAAADRAHVTVRDQGMGIAPEDQIRVFQRFERAVNAGHLDGMGLGLWIVRQLVEAHRGTITLTSEVGVGSTFALDVPIGIGRAEAAAAQ
jgi:signal transduction histidine kinase